MEVTLCRNLLKLKFTSKQLVTTPWCGGGPGISDQQQLGSREHFPSSVWQEPFGLDPRRWAKLLGVGCPRSALDWYVRRLI